MTIYQVEYNEYAIPYNRQAALAAARQVVESVGYSTSPGHVYGCYGYGFSFEGGYQPIDLGGPMFKGHIVVYEKDVQLK